MLAKTESLEKVTLMLAKRSHLRPIILSLRSPLDPDVHQAYLPLKPGIEVEGTVVNGWLLLQESAFGIPLERLESLSALEITVTHKKS